MGDNQLELEVQLKLELENDFDDAIFKKIEAAAQKTAKNVDSTFRSSDFATGMLKTSVRDLINLFKTLNTEAKEYLNSIKQAGKELRKQVSILGSKSASSATNTAIAKEEKERERVLQEEQKIRRVIAQQSVADEQKAAAERERVLQEEQKTRSAILQSNTREQIKNLAKVTAGLGVLKKAFSDGYQALYKFTKLTHEMTVTVVKAFGTMTSSITTFALKLSGLPLILKGINSALSSLTSAIKGAVSGIDFTGLAKESLELSSSLTEVKNVIDVVFGDSAKQIYDFTQSAIKNLGMTTLAAQQYTGKFGAAMRSTGQAAKDTVNMSKALTQLTSDIASFYDIEQDIAAEKIFSGVISGMVKPMRTLGVDITNASLNAWMLAKGLNATYESLNATQKQAVRFEYVMEKLDYVHGDYARTLNTTANQLRLLKNQLKELGSVVGAIINAFFNPFIITLNRVVAAITNVAKSIANIMGIDWTLGTGSGVSTLGGIADDYDDLADSADGLADAEDGVAKSTDKAAKAAKKALAPFHKLNVLQNKQAEDASKSSKSSGKSSGTPYDIAGEGIKNTESKAIDLKQALKNLYDYLMKINWKKAFGRLADAINSVTKDLPKKIRDLFEKVNKLWAKIIEGIDEFLKKLNTYDIGRSIGEIFKGVGNLIYTTLLGIDFKNLGDKFADLLNGILNTEGLAETWGKNLGKAIQDGFEFALGFAKQFDWKNFGQKVYEFVAGALSEIDPQTIYDAIYTTLTGIATSINEFFDNLKKDEESKTKFEEALGAIISGVTDFLYSDEFDDLVDNLSGFISDVLDTLATELDKDENKEKIGHAIDKILEGAGKVLKSGENLASVIWEYVKKALWDFFTDPKNGIPVPFKILAAVEIANLTGVTNMLKLLVEGVIAAKLLGVSSIVGVILIGITAIAAEIAILAKYEPPSFEQAAKNLSQIYYSIDAIRTSFEAIAKVGFLTLLEKVLDTIGNLVKDIPLVGDLLKEAFDKGKTAVSDLKQEVVDERDAYVKATEEKVIKNAEWGKSIDDNIKKVNDEAEAAKKASSEIADDADKQSKNYSKYWHDGTSQVTKELQDTSDIGRRANKDIVDNSKETKSTVESTWSEGFNIPEDAGGWFNTFFSMFGELVSSSTTTKDDVNTELGKIGEGVDYTSNADAYKTDYLAPLELATSDSVDTMNTSLSEIGTSIDENTFANLVNSFGSYAIEPMKLKVAEIGTAFTELLTNLQETFFTPLEGEYSTSFGNILTNSDTIFFTPLETKFGTTFTNIITKLTSEFIPSLDKNISDELNTLSGYLDTFKTEKVDNLFSPVPEWFNTEIFGNITSYFDIFKSDLEGKLDDIKKKIEETFIKSVKDISSAWNEVQKTIESTASSMKSALDAAKSSADDLASSLREAASAYSDLNSARSSVSTSSSSGVQGYASGGVFRPNNPQLALLGDHKSQTEYALTTGHLKQIADMMSNVIGSSGFEGNITIPIYVDGVLSAKKVITASQMHNYRSNGR